MIAGSLNKIGKVQTIEHSVTLRIKASSYVDWYGMMFIMYCKVNKHERVSITWFHFSI